MKVAVVTPYFREPLATLRRCHDSVARQTHPCDHLMVADGHANPEVGAWGVKHLILPASHGDVGNTPRGLGAISALNLGYDAIAFLDADNWYAEDHVGSLVAACRETGAAVAFADRTMVLPSGETVPPEPDETARGHVDTSCFFITAAAASLLPVWAMMDQPLGPMGDRVLFAAIRIKRVPHAWSGQRTVFYESRYAAHFRALGLPVPPDAHEVDMAAVARAYDEARNTARLGFAMGIGFGSPPPPSPSSGEGEAG